MFDIFDENGYNQDSAEDAGNAGGFESGTGNSPDMKNDYSYYDSTPSGGSSTYSYSSSSSDGYSSSGDSRERGTASDRAVRHHRSGSSFRSGSTFGQWIAKAACLGLVFGLVASGVMFGFNKAVGGFTPKETVSSTEVAESAALETSSPVSIVHTSQTAVATTDAQDVSDIVEEVMPSIVAVNTTVESTVTDWFGRQYRQEGTGAGSGIIISSTDDELYILTNCHVIEDSKTVTVQFSDDSKADALVKGSDKDADIAVLEVKLSDLEEKTRSAIKVAVIGDSDSLRAGGSAIAIGNALGYGQSVTTGVISATSREVQLTDKTMTLVQTSAAINPGNSGGALLNGKGEVIGINTVKFSDTDVEGMGYAIPINSAVETATGIINGTVTTKTDDNTPYLGIAGGTLDEETAESYNVPQGVYVSNVVSGSAADRAGLEAGCIITGFNDKEIKTMEELQAAISECAPGDSVTIKAQFANTRGEYSERELKTILGAKSDDTYSDSGNNSGSQSDDSSGSSGYGFGPDIEEFFGNDGGFFGNFGR